MRKFMLALAVSAFAALGCEADGRDYQVETPDIDVDIDRDTNTVRIPDVDIVRDSVTIPVPKVRIDTNP